MNITESIILAIDSIRVNKLRAFLTLLSVAIGVFAIIGTGTLTSSLEGTMTKELEKIGETTFWIKKMPNIVTGNDWRKYSKRKPITYSQVKAFKRKMSITDQISAFGVSQGKTIKYGNESTNPDVTLFGTDEMYFPINAVNVVNGRPIMKQDIALHRSVAVIGNDVAIKLFTNEAPLNKKITIGNHSYTVIGVLEEKGGVLGQNKDNQVMLPITNFLNYYANHWEQSLTISVKAPSRKLIDATIDETIGTLRILRKCKPWEENNFELYTNEAISEMFGGFISFLSAIGWITGGFALIAAGVGIMNIMLVSVKERTREIGIRKAIGARKSWIMLQFIVETITLVQIGGIVGIMLGIAGASLLGVFIGITPVFPIYWIIASVVICGIMGVAFGSYPAWKAANLNPIDALHYE